MTERSRGYAHRVDIVADTSEVWRALTETEHLARWCSPTAQIRAQKGGLFRASVDRVIELEGHIDIFEPARRLRLIYLPSEALPPTDDPLVDDFILDAKEPGTVLRLLGSGIPATQEWNRPYLRLRLGWQQALTRLKVFTEKQLRSKAS
ncbi:MAG: SRPBCC family protein [Steroidobacteraceae bacterium]